MTCEKLRKDTKPVRLRDLRILLFAKDITHEYIAERWGVSHTYISNRVNGKIEFSSLEKEDLCKLLEIKTMPDYIRMFHPAMLGKLAHEVPTP